MVKIALQFFGIILGGSILSAFLGGLFAMIVALISPEFVSDLFGVKEGTSVSRYAFSVGMIWGLFIGAAVTGFVCGLSALISLIRLRVNLKS